ALLDTTTTMGALDLAGDVNVPASTGTFQVDTGAYVESSDGVSPVTGATVGAFVKLNDGNLQVVSTQPLHLSGGGSATVNSYYNVVGGRTIDFTGGTFTFNNPSPIGIAGNILVDGGTLVFSGTSTGTSCSLSATTCITDTFELRSGQFSAV